MINIIFCLLLSMIEKTYLYTIKFLYVNRLIRRRLKCDFITYIQQQECLSFNNGNTHYAFLLMFFLFFHYLLATTTTNFLFYLFFVD